MRLGLLLLLAGLPLRLPAFADAARPLAWTALGAPPVAGLGGEEAGLGALNPALLASAQTLGLGLRYQDLFPEQPGTWVASGVQVGGPLRQAWGWGLGWDHSGTASLAQERVRAGLGWQAGAGFELGAAAGLLWQRAALSQPLPGLNLDRSSQAGLDLQAGARWQRGRLALGLAADQLGSPNLGLLAEERLAPRWQGGGTLSLGAWRWLAGAEQDAGGLDGGLGLQWSPWPALSLRGGAQRRAWGAGFEVRGGAWRLAYAAEGGLGAAASGLQPSHALELGWAFDDGYSGVLAQARESEAQGRWGEAAGRWRKAQALRPGSTLAREGAARSQARWDLERAQRFTVAGDAALAQGDAYGARQRYEWALQLDPAQAAARDGLRRLDAAQPHGALADLRVLKALEAAAAARSAGDLQAARQQLGAAAALHPGDPLLRQALADLERATATPVPTPTPATLAPEALRLLDEAEALAARGQPRLAAERLRQAEALAPAHPELARRREALQRRPESDPEAQRRSRKLMQDGLSAYLEGRLDEAVRLLERAVEADPGNAEALNNLTRARIEKGTP